MKPDTIPMMEDVKPLIGWLNEYMVNRLREMSAKDLEAGSIYPTAVEDFRFEGAAYDDDGQPVQIRLGVPISETDFETWTWTVRWDDDGKVTSMVLRDPDGNTVLTKTPRWLWEGFDYRVQRIEEVK